MKKLLIKIGPWADSHKFHFATLIVLIVGGITVVSQQAMLLTLDNKLKQNKKEMAINLKNTKIKINTDINKIKKNFEEKLHHTSESFNARVDTLSNSINIEDKRRELITNIRNAINENVNHIIGVRDLNRIANAVIDYSYQYNLAIPQVLAQIKVESDFRIRAVSKAGAQGLMQIMPKTLHYIGYDMPDAPPRLNPWNIYHNIKSGCFYMSEQIAEFGTYDEALKAYNFGPDNLKKYNAGERKTMPNETSEYVPKVHRYIEIFGRYGLE